MVTVGVLRWSSPVLLIVLHVGVLVHLGSFPLWLSITVRRLHDTGRSARWLLPYAVVAGVWALIIYWSAESLTAVAAAEGQSVLGFLFVAVFLSGIWALVTLAWAIVILALCSQPGTVGANRYGPEPVRGQPEMQAGGEATPAASDADQRPSLRSPAGNLPRCHGCDGELGPEARFCGVCGTPAQSFP